MRRFARFACIDWSGARKAVQPGIAIACCEEGDAAPRLAVPPRRHWSRIDVLDGLRARAGEDLLVGVDFSAALPFADRDAYFPELPGSPADARALWRFVEERCRDDPHLAATSIVSDPVFAPYFRAHGVTGARFASIEPACTNGRLRVVERRAESGRPTSSFNLVGAAQVGRSSLTGMRVLHALSGEIAIWPFGDVPSARAVLVEIYTSIAATAGGRPLGATKMTSVEALNAALTHPRIGSLPYPGAGRIDDHSSDAILTAAWLRRAAGDERLWRPRGLAPVRASEGWTFGVP